MYYLSNSNFAVLDNVHFVASLVLLYDFSAGRILALFHSIDQLIELVLVQATHEGIGEEGIGDYLLFADRLGDHNQFFRGDDFSVVGFGGDSVSDGATGIESLKMIKIVIF